MSSVLHLFLESDHLMFIREKILSTKAFEPGTLRTNETILNMLIKLAFPRIWKTVTHFSLVDFVVSCVAFFIFFLTSTKLFIELVHTHGLCHFEGNHHLLQVSEGKLLM